MSLDTDRQRISTYKIITDYRITGIHISLAPEVYIVDDDHRQMYAIHPVQLTSNHKIYLADWPSSEVWKDLFYFFAVHDEYTFCEYANKLSSKNNSILNNEQIANLIKAFNYSASRFSDIAYTAGLQGYKQRLLIEKKVPIKILKLLDNSEDYLNEELASCLLRNEITSSVSREIIQNWVDLTKESRSAIINAVYNLLGMNSHQNISDIFRRQVYLKRYPEYNHLLEKIERLVSRLPNSIQIDYDPLLELNSYQISTRIENHRDLLDFVDKLCDNNNIIILTELIELLNET